jgi:hypothetical protein
VTAWATATNAASSTRERDIISIWSVTCAGRRKSDVSIQHMHSRLISSLVSSTFVGSRHCPSSSPVMSHPLHKVETDHEATAAIQRAEEFFAHTTVPSGLAAMEKRMGEWAAAQLKTNRKVICITSGTRLALRTSKHRG